MAEFETELHELTTRRVDLANKYAVERKTYGESKAEIDIILAGYILDMQEKKKNIGYEMALITLIARKPEVGQVYKKMISHYNNYKAIEKMIDATESRIMSLQSVMKFYRENDGGM